MLIVSVSIVFGAEDSSNGNNTEKNVTKISWNSDKNKDKNSNENVQQKSDSQKKSEEKVKESFSDAEKGNSTKESSDNGKKIDKNKQDKDLTLEELLKTIETVKKSQSKPSSTTPEPTGYRNNFENSDVDFGNYPSSFPYSPYHPEDPYSASYEDYPPIPPPYQYPRFPPSSSESPPSSPYSGSDSAESGSGNYAPRYFPDDYELPASWFDPTYFPDETFDDSNNANHLYSEESYASHEETEVDKRYPKSVHPYDEVYRLNDPVFLDEPCPCSGFHSDNVQYKRHALPPLPFGPKDDKPLKFELPKPQWIAKLKQLHEDKKLKKLEFEPSHVKSRSADEVESPLPSEFFEGERSGSGFGNVFTSNRNENHDEDSLFK